MRRHAWASAGLLSAITLVCASGAHAQDDAIVKLYDEGERALQANNVGEACGKFKTAWEQPNAKTKLGLMLRVAFCKDTEGQKLTAFALYRQVEALAPDEDRKNRAREEMKRLESFVPHIVLNNVPAGASVQIDGKAIDPFPPNGYPVGAGPHNVLVLKEGKKFEAHPQITEGDTAKPIPFNVVLTDSVGDTGKPPPGGDTGPRPETPGGDDGSGKRIVGFIVGGVGVVGIAVGSVFGLKALGVKSDCGDNPPDPNNNNKKPCNNPPALDSDKTAATISTISFGVGAAALAVGAYLIFTAGPSSAPAPTTGTRVVPMVGQNGGGLAVFSRW